MTQIQDLSALADRLPNRRHREAVQFSVQQHVRNGRGFWPMVEVDGVRKIIAFRPQVAQGPWGRWTPEAGRIEVLDPHQIAVSDWPRVQITVN